MLDIAYVYMDVYLPTAEAGKVKIGADARIVLDACPIVAIPAKVSFIATQAQFTPKTVETKDERDKLMFRIRVKIDPERLRAHAAFGEKRPARRRLCAARSGDCLAAQAARERRAVIERERPVARIESVTQRYGRAVALDDVTIELPAGCMVGFIGPDGVGKSSLLSMIAGRAADPIRKRFRPRRRHGGLRRIGPRSALASPICRKDWARISMRTSVSARTSSFLAACSGNPVPNGTRKSPSCSRAPGSRPFPTVQRRNCRAACGRSSGFAAVSSTIRIS